MHRLISKNVDAMTGECQECGPVELRFRINPNKPGKIVMCGTARKLDRRNSRKLTKKPHGLNAYEVAEFLEGKACAICGTREGLVVDHCHAQNKIRDALCGGCNTGLGLFKDDPVRLLAAVAYLKCHAIPG